MSRCASICYKGHFDALPFVIRAILKRFDTNNNKRSKIRIDLNCPLSCIQYLDKYAEKTNCRILLCRNMSNIYSNM